MHMYTCNKQMLHTYTIPITLNHSAKPQITGTIKFVMQQKWHNIRGLYILLNCLINTLSFTASTYIR